MKISIEIKVEGDSCKGCVHSTPLTELETGWNYSCDVFGEDLGDIIWNDYPKRLPECIEAEGDHERLKERIELIETALSLACEHSINPLYRDLLNRSNKDCQWKSEVKELCDHYKDKAMQQKKQKCELCEESLDMD
jgi:hypothetical protein